jgi:hypothetical protein
VLFVFVVYPGFNGYDRAMFPDMVYGKAYKPFVYRTLLPSAVRAVAEVTPDAVKNRISPAVERRMHLLQIPESERGYAYEYFVALVLMYCCFVGLAYTLRHLTAWFYDYPAFVADLAPVGGLLVLPVFFKYYSYVYDPCTLLLFSLAVASIVARKRRLFYLLFVLATFNKETSILLSGLFFIYEYQVMRKSVLTGHLFVSCHFGSRSGHFWCSSSGIIKVRGLSSTWPTWRNFCSDRSPCSALRAWSQYCGC